MRTNEQVARLLDSDWEKSKKIFADNTEFTFQGLESPEEFFVKNAFIAGGAIASYFHEEEPQDIDVFFVGGLKEHGVFFPFKVRGFHFVTANLGDSPESIAAGFDFEHCMFYYRNGKLHTPIAYQYLRFSNKELAYRPGSRRPGAALLRAGKFQERGWRFRMAEAEEIIQEIICGHESGKTNIELVSFDDYVPA